MTEMCAKCYAASFDRFLADVSETHRAAAPRLRYGQVFFNTLDRDRPALAQEICGKRLDPFHREEVEPELLEWLERYWEAGPFAQDQARVDNDVNKW